MQRYCAEYTVKVRVCDVMITTDESEEQIKEKFSSLVKEYFEFPPIYLPEKTRWGDSFDEYEIKKPLFSDKNDMIKDIFSFDNYTHICYMEMSYGT